MDVIVPDLCATDNYLKVAQLCLLKMEKLQEIASLPNTMNNSFNHDTSLEAPKIIECQNIITGLVAALNQSITEQKDWKLLNISLLQNDGRHSKPKKGSDDYWRKLIFGFLCKLKSDSHCSDGDICQRKIQLRQDIFKQIESSENRALLVNLF